MKIVINRVDNNYNLKATNPEGQSLVMDAAPEIGGSNKGMRPMQLLISALGGCSSIDIINILRKQRQELKDIKVEIKAEREQGKTPSLFTQIHVHFILTGKIDHFKAKKAVELSMEKYCSVSRILEKSANIYYTFELHTHEEQLNKRRRNY
jgi:putative redox protein